MNLIELKQQFTQYFNAVPSHIAFAPGRVNLIGEYTDFNGGHVFPCALSNGTYALASRRTDRIVRVMSVNFEQLGVIEFALDGLAFEPQRHWANYPAGVFAMLMAEGVDFEQGLNILFAGDIPNGAGLSSSASIEMVTAVLLRDVYGIERTQLQLVQLSQQSENQFNGMNCGIMDQFAVGMGRVAHALLLNTATLDYQTVPVDLGAQYTLLIANTNKRRELADSKYNERRAECEAALADLQKVVSIQALCALNAEQFAQYEHVIENDLARQRARHVIGDNQRTLQAVTALQAGDISTFGQLLNASHRSLRDDFGVTGAHLDALVQAAWDHGAVGARMTGAGFGGCTVMIVRTAELESFKQNVAQQYQAATGMLPTFYDVRIGDGARMLELA